MRVTFVMEDGAQGRIDTRLFVADSASDFTVSGGHTAAHALGMRVAEFIERETRMPNKAQARKGGMRVVIEIEDGPDARVNTRFACEGDDDDSPASVFACRVADFIERETLAAKEAQHDHHLF